MELARVFLLSALFLVGLMIWNAWENENANKVITPVVGTTISQPVQGQVPVTTTATSPVPVATPIPAAVVKNTATTVSAATNLIHVQTDVLDLDIDPVGGNIVQTRLLAYPEQLHNSTPYELLSNDPNKLYVAQSGLIGNGGPDTAQTQAQFSSKQSNYVLKPDQDLLKVELTWRNPNGLQVTKQFIFRRNNYQIDVNYHIDNQSSKAWNGQFYAQLERKKLPPASHGLFVIKPYVGGAISSANKPYQKVSFDNMAEQNLNLPIQGGWAAMLEHYFLSAWIPPSTQTFTYYTQALPGNVFNLGILGPELNIAPGTQADTNAKLYLGPESMDRLKAVAPNLDLTIDYGMLWFISIAIFWLMKQIYHVVGNWGWAIVLVTLLIKLAFFHLSAKSYRSMAAMRRLQPRLQMLKERYGEDKQKLSRATMELYKKEKINPLSGCLPIVVQIPVFIALYWVLIESVELRQAPFILWIHDLSAKDPYFVLPIIMGITMFIQQRLNPAPPDPIQARMMNFLPVFFTFLFISFPAGLVLYWIVNNTLSILQQWFITHRMEVSENNKKARA